MKNVKKQAAQGDVFVRRVAKLPKKAQKDSEGVSIIVGHSETGHHHVLECAVMDPPARFYKTENPLLSYVEVLADQAQLVHKRSFDTHETLELPKGYWEIRQQREMTPEGWRRVAD